MADKGTTGDLASEFENLGQKILNRTMVLGDGLIELTAEQLVDLAEMTEDIALAIAGDKRAELHVKAQLSLKKFSIEARAWLEMDTFRKAVADAILEVVGALVSQGAKLVGEALASALTGALDG